jgi:hypothetical protein
MCILIAMGRCGAGALLLCLVVLSCPVAADAACPVAPDAGALPDAAGLKDMNAFLGPLRARPTGSAQQKVYVDWIRKQVQAIPGVKLTEQPFTIDRWSVQSTKLRLRIDGKLQMLPVASAIPYSLPTSKKGVAGPAVLVPEDQPITDAARGRIVVRPAPAGSVPMYDFMLPVVSWERYDPGNTFDPNGNFYGDFINYNKRVTDLRDAAKAGAKGLLFVKELPRRQLVGHYEPYEGSAWKVPGMFLGVDEGKAITDAIGGGHTTSIRIVERAGYKKVETPSLEAVLPGAGPQRIVIDSHTDGTNAVEDNGPVAMVAMLRYYAALPLECRPRTLQFAFSTAHFYQRVANAETRHGGAGQLAEQLDREYDSGSVAGVVVIEHLGARDYEMVPRKDGGPGSELALNGLRSIQFIAITPSPALVSAVDSVVRSYDLQRTILLQGADAPGSTVPSHCSFGGEGTPYNVHLLPTIGIIAAPQTLYDPAFELEAIDFDVMHSEVLAYTELINRMQTMSQSDIAGSVPADRARRANGGQTCPNEI